ncbi:unnamed protein product [Orchesella dallaii]|uniref:Uncharacterized protein n=1 Tax=Orchesella dallaii TaxID=48710 RepID=A0ABP1QYR3_9HEXA
MDSTPDSRLYQYEGLIISSVTNDVDEPGVLDKMMGLARPGCYEECAMEKVAAVGPGSTAQSPHLTLSFPSASSCCHCSSLEHQCTTPLKKKKRIPNSSSSRRVLFEIPMTKRPKRQQLSF